VNSENLRPWLEKFGRGGLILGLLATTACETPAISVPTPYKATPVPVSTLGQAETASQLPPIVGKFYPELRQVGLTVKDSQTLVTKLHEVTVIYNFMNSRINVAAAQAVYGYFDSLLNIENPVIFRPYSINGQNRSLKILPQPNINQRVAVIIPENAPKPGWASPVDLLNQPAATIYNQGTAFSYIKSWSYPIGLFQTEEEILTVEFATEACQQTVYVEVDDGKNNPVANERIIGQEAVCNSLGTAAAARLLDKPYQKYLDYVNNAVMGLTPQGERIRFISVTPRSYEALQPEGLIIINS
jgi:hypothetical protein